MRKLIALAAAAATLAAAGTAVAITNGQFDGNNHPNVGAFLWDGNHDGVKTQLCTGTLVSTRVFVTASHCTEYAERNASEAWVTFDPTDVEDNPTGVYHGKLVTNPLYNAKQLYQHDVSLILLDKPIKGIAPAKIAPVGLLDQMWANGTIRTAAYVNVGYGTHEQVIVKGSGPDFPWTGDREFSTSAFAALDPKMIHLSQNLAQGLGGSGYGDSGGPTFVDTPTGPVTISTVSTGDVPLYATSVNTRLDTREAHDFLAPYLALR